jgi:hypothetical protein
MPVYIIRAGETDNIKIGWADDVDRRLYTLQTGHYEMLQIIRIIDTAEAGEHWLHRHFSEHHIRLEWFRFHPDMLTVIVPDFPVFLAAQIIDSLGGAPILSKALNLPPTTVANWRGRGSIPARYHHALLEVGAGKVSAEQIDIACAGAV